MALPFGMLLGQDVALVGAVAAQMTPPRQLDPLAECALRLLLRHSETLGCQVSGVGCQVSGRATLAPDARHRYFGASTIDMLRPSSFGSCSIFATSFSSLATRSSTARPRSMCAICRPRYII